VPSSENGRYQSGASSWFALGIGDRSFIIGTLYDRLLAQKLTHGYIRHGAANLELLAQTVSAGTLVVIC